MAYSYFEVIASGGNTFNIPFDYIDQGEVSVYVDGAEASFTFTSSNVIDITPAPANGALVRIERATNLSERAVDFASGAVLTEEDLDKSNIQVYHAAQEALDKVEQTMQVDVDGKWEGQDRVIKNVADPVADTDAVNRQFITTNLPAINRVHQSINNVDTVANDLNEAVSEIDTVAGSITNVNTVGDAIANVNTTATHIANVNRVAQSADNVDTVQASIGNVDTTAGSIDNVNNVGDNIGDVVTVAANMTDVNTVANDIDKVITAANDLNEAVSEINTVAGNITAVDTVGANIANVNTVANVSTDVTKLVDRYYVQSTQPTSGMVQGDLWYSTAQNQLYTYTGTKWELTSVFSEAVVRENNYVATANQTAFVGTDKNGSLMTLVDGATEFVYQNGILIEPTVDYTMDYATATVNLVVGASVDDEIRVVQINPFDSLEYNALVGFRDEADAAQAAAESARDLAQTYRDTALSARDAAQVSQAAALASENSAAASEAAAANSEAAAATSETNAATSEANAAISANVAAHPWEVDSTTGDVSYTSGKVRGALVPTVSDTEPNEPSEGQLWYDSATLALKHYDGFKWLQVTNKFTAAGGSEGTYSVDGQLFKYHVFTSSGVFSTSSTGQIDYVLVAGGGGGGGANSSSSLGGAGGGGGGHLSGSITINPGEYTVTIGAGGAGAATSATNRGGTGGNTSFNGMTALGGGGGATRNNKPEVGGPGGSGGGAAGTESDLGGAGTAGQGNRGGNTGPDWGAGGGGGKGSAGGDALGMVSADGGNGVYVDIHPDNTVVAGGGGGGGNNDPAGATGGQGSASAGDGGSIGDATGGNAPVNQGGGGGGSTSSNGNTVTSIRGGNGGSGVVYIRYPA